MYAGSAPQSCLAAQNELRTAVERSSRDTFLLGAANNGTGRNWKTDVALTTQLIGAMRSISSHWKRDFDEQEPDLESEILTRTEEAEATSPLENVASHAPSQERELAAIQQWELIAARCQGDAAATKVLKGLATGLTASQIMHDYELSKSQYQQAMKRIRLRAGDIDRQDRRIQQKGKHRG